MRHYNGFGVSTIKRPVNVASIWFPKSDVNYQSSSVERREPFDPEEESYFERVQQGVERCLVFFLTKLFSQKFEQRLSNQLCSFYSSKRAANSQRKLFLPRVKMPASFFTSWSGKKGSWRLIVSNCGVHRVFISWKRCGLIVDSLVHLACAVAFGAFSLGLT